MPRVLNKLSDRWLFSILCFILTVGLVAALYGLQQNSNEDFETAQKADAAQAIAFCHALSDNNQAVRDILSLLSVDSKVTEDMTPSQKESIRFANERRKGYRIIAETLFPVPTCTDGYKARSRQDQLEPLLNVPVGTTTTTQK